ncbi:MAG: HAD-IA family hydrolase [Deltaproteobacteria bacterium]|nr:HAD-IA family hydrolase [Deltaproteobacteria bacterium]
MIAPSLVANVSLLCLDAGNTVIFLDHAVVSEVLLGEGFVCDIETLRRAEGEAKRALSDGTALAAVPGFSAHAGWSVMVRTMIERAGIPAQDSARCVRALWQEHDRLNLWRSVPEGLRESLCALRAAKVPVCIVSNSEGKLSPLFEALALSECFDAVIDSALVGVEKPDPAIFALALERFGVRKENALHLGDTVATDIVGAQRAGIRTALLDPFAHYEGMYPEVPRVADVRAVVLEIMRQSV